MQIVRVCIFLYVYVFLFCSVVPFTEPPVIPPESGAFQRYLMQVEPVHCLIPPQRIVPERYQEMFMAAAMYVGIPPGVLEAIADVESNFRAWARSPMRDDGHRDLGMFQFNDRYHEWYSDRYNDGILFDPFDPAVAIRVAALHVHFLYNRYGHWPDVFLAYNAGMSRVDNNDIPASAFNYLAKIYRGNVAKNQGANP
jgi:soluble lytic murein transglycosylase-like protein